MKINNLITIDPSVSSTAMVRYDIEKDKYTILCFTSKIKNTEIFQFDNVEVIIIKHPKVKYRDNFEKKLELYAELAYLIDTHINCHDSLVYIEDYAYAGSKIVQMTEWGTLLKKHFYEFNKTVDPIGIGEWKKAVIGKGNAKKDQIVEFCKSGDLKKLFDFLEEKGYNYKYKSTKNFHEDICDAWCIMKYVLEFNKIGVENAS